MRIGILLSLQNFDIFSAIILSLDVLENAFIFFSTSSISYYTFASFSFSFFMLRLYSALVLGALLKAAELD